MKMFDKEYKLMAVKRVKESEKPVAEVARELDLGPKDGYIWRELWIYTVEQSLVFQWLTT